MVLHGYSTLLEEVPLPGATARRLVTPEGLRNDDLGQRLADLRDRVEEEGDQSPVVGGVLDHLRHVHWHYTVEVTDPSQCHDWAEESQVLLENESGAILDPEGRVIIGRGAGENGRVPLQPDAVERAARVRRDLAARDVIVPEGALPVRSPQEVRLRRPDLVGRRAVALVFTADFAISILEGQPLNWRAMAGVFPLSFGDRTPIELQLFETEDERLAQRLKWGYEAAAALLAMCGRVNLVFPTDFADQGQVWNSSVGVEEPALLPSLELLPKEEICEAWERARALHHAMTLRTPGVRSPGGVDPQIVRQRYRALEWLTGDDAWDDVSIDVPVWA